MAVVLGVGLYIDGIVSFFDRSVRDIQKIVRFDYALNEFQGAGKLAKMVANVFRSIGDFSLVLGKLVMADVLFNTTSVAIVPALTEALFLARFYLAFSVGAFAIAACLLYRRDAGSQASSTQSSVATSC